MHNMTLKRFGTIRGPNSCWATSDLHSGNTAVGKHADGYFKLTNRTNIVESPFGAPFEASLLARKANVHREP